MKTFKQYIIEEVLSFSDALKIFNIDKVPNSRSDFDKLFRQLAMKNHPDLGGSTEAMKKLNMAKEILVKHLGKGKTEIEKAEQEEAQSKYQAEEEQAFNIAMQFFKKIDLELYKVYFKKIFNRDFFAESKSPEWKSGKYVHNMPYIDIEIFTRERDIVFYVHLGSDIYRLHRDIFGNKGLSTSNVTFDYYIMSECFIENKKQVITKEKYIRSTDASVLTKPETLFPKVRMEKLASGTVRQNSTLKKRDFESMFKMQYKADNYNNWWFIPYKTVDTFEYYISIYRTTFMKMAAYTFGDLYVKDTSKTFGIKKTVDGIPKIKLNYMPETKETFDLLKSIFDFAKSNGNETQIANKINAIKIK